VESSISHFFNSLDITDVPITVGDGATAVTNDGGATSTTTVAVKGTASLPGVYVMTIGGQAATITVLPSTSTTSTLTAVASTATPIASATDMTITVARNAGAAKTDGIILGSVTAVSQADATAPTTVGTIFGKTASKTAGMTSGTAADSGTAFTMDLAATSAAGSYGAGTYSFRFWNDVNLNQTYDASEVSTTLTVVIGGASDSISVSISDSVLSSDANYNTFTVTATVYDADGGNTTDTVLVSETTSAGSTTGDLNLTSIVDATALTRIGTTNQYTGTFTVDTAYTSADYATTCNCLRRHNLSNFNTYFYQCNPRCQEG